MRFLSFRVFFVKVTIDNEFMAIACVHEGHDEFTVVEFVRHVLVMLTLNVAEMSSGIDVKQGST